MPGAIPRPTSVAKVIARARLDRSRPEATFEEALGSIMEETEMMSPFPNDAELDEKFISTEAYSTSGAEMNTVEKTGETTSPRCRMKSGGEDRLRCSLSAASAAPTVPISRPA
jgi:hypothetical protein